MTSFKPRRLLTALLPLLLCATFPAYADEGFCDDRNCGVDDLECPTNGEDDDCSIDGMVHIFDEALTVPPVRNLKLDSRSAPAAFQVTLSDFNLDVLGNPSGNEVTMIELSFAAVADEGGARVLAISLDRENGDVMLRADLLATDSADWSFADQHGDQVMPTLLDSRELSLGSRNGQTLPPITFELNKHELVIQTRAGEAIFPLGETSGWLPYRLRAGMLLATQIQKGTGAALDWEGSLPWRGWAEDAR